MRPRDVVRRERKRRGDPTDTAARLVAAAALELEQHGYHGTDVPRIAQAAGYATGTFYKHFADKSTVFLAVYDEWVKTEWDELSRLFAEQEPRSKRARVERAIAFLIEHHRRWRTFRASLRALVASDPVVRRHHTAARRAQLERFVALVEGYADPTDAALAMLYVERVCDAIATGELAALGVDQERATQKLVTTLMR